MPFLNPVAIIYQESRRLHEETIKVLRNEEKGEVYDRKKKQSQKMAQ